MSGRPRIGMLRTRLSLERPIDSADDSGAFARSWTQVAQLWGRVVPAGGDEQFTAGAIETAIPHVVMVRARSDIANGMRFTIGGRALLIRAVTDPDGRGRMLACRCEEFAP